MPWTTRVNNARSLFHLYTYIVMCNMYIKIKAQRCILIEMHIFKNVRLFKNRYSLYNNLNFVINAYLTPRWRDVTKKYIVVLTIIFPRIERVAAGEQIQIICKYVLIYVVLFTSVISPWTTMSVCPKNFSIDIIDYFLSRTLKIVALVKKIFYLKKYIEISERMDLRRVDCILKKYSYFQHISK